MCFGLDKPQNIKGFTADGITIDEIQEVKPSAYHEVLRPMLLIRGDSFGVLEHPMVRIGFGQRDRKPLARTIAWFGMRPRLA